jgi:hypothetical protein
MISSLLRLPRRRFPFHLLPALGAILLLPPASAFTVIKNVNTGQPPVEKLVIFDKTKGAATPVTFTSDNCTTELAADGAIQCDITGNKKMRVEINWKPRPDLPATFDATQYNFLLLTCRMEGVVHTTDVNGKSRDLPRGNLYFSAELVDKDGQNVGYANLADVTEDEKTPATTVTLDIPMVLFVKGSPNDAAHIRGLAFAWGDTHPEQNRDFHLVIDKIALGE